MSCDDVVSFLAGAEKESARGVDALAEAGKGGIVVFAEDGDRAADEGVVTFILIDETGKSVLGAMAKGLADVGGEGDQGGCHVKRLAGDFGQGGDVRAKGFGGARNIGVDVDADADEVGFVDAEAEEAAKFFVLVKEIVGPFDLDVVVVGQSRAGVAGG